MGKIKEKLVETFIDNTDLEIAHHEIGHLRDLCDAKDMVIYYQKDLLNTQSESLKRYRQLEEELNKLKESLETKKRGKKND